MKRGLSFSYVARNLVVRKLTTILTASGMALVVFVFAAVLMTSAGLRQTLSGTGSYDNVMIIRQGSQTEVQSTISREQANILSSLPGLSSDGVGNPILSPEVLVLVNMPRKDGGGLANIVVRGTSENGLHMRPQIHIQSGRQFRPGSSEVIIGKGLTRGKLGLRLGDTMSFGLREWRIVGVFDAGASGFDSEVWGDGEQMMQAFRRQSYSSVVVNLRDRVSYDVFAEAVKQQPRLNVDIRRESLFYADQSEKMTNFIDILGNTITVIFSVGAVIGAMITMYSSVANRTREIGTLRALGFQRSNIVSAFLQEAMLLGFIAGVFGLIGASFMQFVEISTTNIQTFSEVVFKLILTPAIVLQVMLFSLFMGVLGGVLPAIRASRLEIVDALRTG
ncbi:ABC transporter permease [Aquirhabdus parva]|uniref:ABC transporter permease n=1 Tax=Aquirhabdus parva TaxID=2283318 RepID=A0A345P391_9GAMM|nr:ABC transporter permease [Aquirhabdus parva]AXI01750.1 ABC transporter permease [Aquirhabdus parva]